MDILKRKDDLKRKILKVVTGSECNVNTAISVLQSAADDLRSFALWTDVKQFSGWMIDSKGRIEKNDTN